MSRKYVGRRIDSINYCVVASIKELQKYIKKSKEKLIAAASNSNSNIRTKSRTIKKKTTKQKWK